MPRIYQIAKELNVNSKALIKTARKIGVLASSHLSVISEGDCLLIRRMVKIEQAPPKPVEKVPPKPAEKTPPKSQSPTTVVIEPKAAPKPPPAKAPKKTNMGTSTEKNRGRRKFVVTEKDRGGSRRRKPKGAPSKPQVAVKITSAKVSLPITVKGLCGAFGVKSDQIIMALMKQGQMRRINDFLEKEEIEALSLEFEIDVTFKDAQDRFSSAEAIALGEEDKDAPTESRPPVVTLLGHVDHGKTTLLDKIRGANVAATEAGGITQHIGAFTAIVEGPEGPRTIAFLDTPGHEAFSAMRARGAQATDIVVLVVAADDGVMPTTREAIEHAQAAEVPIIVALTKVDKPNANPIRVMGELAAIGLAPTGDWGGSTEVVEVSAYQGTGIEDLLITIALEADVRELTYTPSRLARGVVLEASKDAYRGITTTFLVQDGMLRVKDTVLAGHTFGTIRRMEDSHGKKITCAAASTPVKIFGLSEVPQAGDKFQVTRDVAATQQLADEIKRAAKLKELAIKHSSNRSQGFIDALEKATQNKEVSFILKADTQGSVEVISSQIPTLSTDEISVNIRRAAVGPITEADVQLAASTNAKIIGFHVAPNDTALKAARLYGVEILTYRLIHELLDGTYKLLEGQLGTEKVEKSIGRAEIKQLFTVNKNIKVAGCRVTQGIAARNAFVRIYRSGIEVTANREQGYKLSSLKDHKQDAKEIKEGHECGLVLDGFGDFKVGDMLEFIRVSQKARTFSTT